MKTTTTTNYINYMGTGGDLGTGGIVLYLPKILAKGYGSILREIHLSDAQITISDKKLVSPR